MTRSPEVVLLLPGQGAQHPGMAVDLYGHHDVFHAAMDDVLTLWGAEGTAIRSDWIAGRPAIEMDDIRRSQPLLFAVDYALATTVRETGIEPAAVVGHSVGEVAAAVIAGIVSLRDAAELVAERIARLADSPAGGMLAVATSVDEATPYLTEDVDIGAVNGPRQIMLAGLVAPLDEVQQRLQAAGIITRRARTHNPFHSRILTPYAMRSLSSLQKREWSAPAVPLYSGYTGGLLDEVTATDPAFWAAQPAKPVYFADALDAVAESGQFVFVEAGPGQSLTTLARRNPRVTKAGSRAVALLPAKAPAPGGDLRHFTDAIARIHSPAPPPGKTPTIEAVLS